MTFVSDVDKIALADRRSLLPFSLSHGYDRYTVRELFSYLTMERDNCPITRNWRVATSVTNRQTNETEVLDFVQCTVTGDDTGVHCCSEDRKLGSVVWKNSASSVKMNFMTAVGSGKVMARKREIPLRFVHCALLYNLLQIEPTWCTNFLNMFIAFLYMFRATMCPSSGENTVPMGRLVFVTLYR